MIREVRENAHTPADLVGYTLAALAPAAAPELDDLRACAWLTELADAR